MFLLGGNKHFVNFVAIEINKYAASPFLLQTHILNFELCIQNAKLQHDQRILFIYIFIAEVKLVYPSPRPDL